MRAMPPVLWSVMVTVAPATGAPLSSRTTPAMPPVFVWACVAVALAVKRARARRKRREGDIRPPCAGGDDLGARPRDRARAGLHPRARLSRLAVDCDQRHIRRGIRTHRYQAAAHAAGDEDCQAAHVVAAVRPKAAVRTRDPDGPVARQ